MAGMKRAVVIVSLAVFHFIALSPVLYLLSAGPAMWLVKHGYMGVPTFFATYQPAMAFAYDHQWFNSFMNWYLSWWGGPLELSQ